VRSWDLSTPASGAGRLAAALGEHLAAKLRHAPRPSRFPRRCHWCDRQVRYRADALNHEQPACETWSLLVTGRAAHPGATAEHCAPLGVETERCPRPQGDEGGA